MVDQRDRLADMVMPEAVRTGDERMREACREASFEREEERRERWMRRFYAHFYSPAKRSDVAGGAA